MSIRFTAGDYSVQGALELPTIFESYRKHAVLFEEIELRGEGALLFVAAGRSSAAWPPLVVVQRFQPEPDQGFHPGVLLAGEGPILFVGAGTRLLAYDLRGPTRLWEDSADIGFWGWQLHQDVVVMAAEIEMAAWTTRGEKLWSTFVEPPWDYDVKTGRVLLDVMGTRSEFPLLTGPEKKKVPR